MASATGIKSAKQFADSMNSAELKEMAAKLGIEIIGNPKKIDIAEKILAKQLEMKATYTIQPSEPVDLLSMIQPEQATEQASVEPATEQATPEKIALRWYILNPSPEYATIGTFDTCDQAINFAQTNKIQDYRVRDSDYVGSMPERIENTTSPADYLNRSTATEQATEKTPVIIHPATDEAPPEVAKLFTIYTTGDESLDDAELLASGRLNRTLLEVKSLTGMRLYQIDLTDCSRGDVISQLGDFLFNGHNALTRKQWVKIASDTEVLEGNRVKFPSLTKVVTEEKIISLVELEDPSVDPFAEEANKKRIAEIQTQIAALQEELRTLKKSSKSKSIGGSGLVIRQNVFKTGSTFAETVAMCELIESDGYAVAMEKYGKTNEYVKRAHRAYAEIYLKSEVIKNLFDAKKISWAAIYKIAGSNPEKIGMAAIETKALAVAKQ